MQASAQSLTPLAYRSKMITLMQAVGMFPVTAIEPFDPVTEQQLQYAHSALSIIVLGIPDKFAPSMLVDDAQQFLIKMKTFAGPADSHWSSKLSAAMISYFASIRASQEFLYMQKLMVTRQAGELRNAWTKVTSTLPKSALRQHGLMTDALANSIRWRIILLNDSMTSVYDTHALPGENTSSIGVKYSSREEVLTASVSGVGWAIRRGDEYGYNDTISYVCVSVVTHLPYSFVLFSRVAVM